ncbi:phage tail assembly chaperone [Pseudomonas guariconensis]|uniref:phage tail assembly chaperone n=1 Tax=Pseudomonas TaxID=286 RepID=UPI0020985AFA|nr:MULTISPECIES: phage tail assembly chaperone [Pseudomonas]MCO7640757.1 phage tail assembly chaperone [Pseudomonas sp. S 311-6]MCO7515708.1 phage tail assembly chaperone [Pseudomonas putida]MCO7566451.1 phage tail assembly chaperone [Pseudomonas mosselii]MCO7605699.1 phage tail assembly chaperone [Pseudomonas guariconensis]MCO7617479.1 phage tail assembly chaperone [Pseudomonas guariconensis]
MPKIKIAQDPTFTAPVKVPRIGREPESVDFQFRYMDRVELAALFDRWNKARDAWAEQIQKSGASWEEVTAGEISLQAEQLKDIVVGWDLEDEFSDEAIVELVRTCTGAPKAVTDAFQAAYNPARLGN